MAQSLGAQLRPQPTTLPRLALAVIKGVLRGQYETHPRITKSELWAIYREDPHNYSSHLSPVELQAAIWLDEVGGDPEAAVRFSKTQPLAEWTAEEMRMCRAARELLKSYIS